MALFGFESALWASSLLGVRFARGPLDPHAPHAPHSLGASSLHERPVRLEDVRWETSASASTRAVLRARSVRIGAPRLGPFAFRVWVTTALEDVSLHFEDDAGARTEIVARSARRDGDRWVLEGAVRARGPAGREIQVERLAWTPGEMVLVADAATPHSASARTEQTVRRRASFDLWLAPIADRSGEE